MIMLILMFCCEREMGSCALHMTLSTTRLQGIVWIGIFEFISTHRIATAIDNAVDLMTKLNIPENKQTTKNQLSTRTSA